MLLYLLKILPRNYNLKNYYWRVKILLQNISYLPATTASAAPVKNISEIASDLHNLPYYLLKEFNIYCLIIYIFKYQEKLNQLQLMLKRDFFCKF